MDAEANHRGESQLPSADGREGAFISTPVWPSVCTFVDSVTTESRSLCFFLLSACRCCCRDRGRHLMGASDTGGGDVRCRRLMVTFILLGGAETFRIYRDSPSHFVASCFSLSTPFLPIYPSDHLHIRGSPQSASLAM